MLWFFDNNKFPWQLTARQRKFIQENSIFINLLIFLSSMFEYKDFNPELNTDFIEFYNILTPRAASGVFKNKDGKEVIGWATEGGTLNDYGYPDMWNINTLGKSNKQGVISGENGAICFNNKTHTSDLVSLYKYTELMHLCDTAQKCLMKYARLFPVFEIDNEQVRQQLKNALKNAEEGEPFTFTSKGLSKIGSDGEPGMKIQQLGDISAVDKIQYLSTYHNDLLRRFFSMYGLPYSLSTKQAQQSIEEVHSEANIAFVIPNDRLAERNAFAEDYRKWNPAYPNARVEFSEAWLNAYKNYVEGGEENEDIQSTESSGERSDNL